MGNPFHRGIYAYKTTGDDPDPTTTGFVGFFARFIDGVSHVVQPDWEQMTVQTVIGTIISQTGEVFKGGVYTLEARAEVKHSYGRYVIFGVSKNDGAIVEIGRAQCNDNDFVFVITSRMNITLNEGDMVKFFISSDFEWEDFTWRNCEIQGITPQ